MKRFVLAAVLAVLAAPASAQGVDKYGRPVGPPMTAPYYQDDDGPRRYRDRDRDGRRRDYGRYDDDDRRWRGRGEWRGRDWDDDWRRSRRYDRGDRFDRGDWRSRRAGVGFTCITSRGICPVGRPLPLNAPCRCDIPGFGEKRGAVAR